MDRLDLMPFARTLGIRLLTSDPEAVRARLDWDEQLCTAGNVLHGGALMTLADSTAALCAYLNLPAGAAGTTTIESKTNFLRAVASGYVEARSHPLHVGQTIVIVETDLRDDRDRPVARTLQTQLVLTPR